MYRIAKTILLPMKFETAEQAQEYKRNYKGATNKDRFIIIREVKNPYKLNKRKRNGI